MVPTAQDIADAAQLEQQGDAAGSRDLAISLYKRAQALLMPTGVLWTDRAEYEARMLAFSRVQEKLYGVADRLPLVAAAKPAADPKTVTAQSAETSAAADSAQASGAAVTRQQQLAAIGRTLDEVEAEMKRIGFWSADPPDLQAAVAQGRIRSFLDAPSFELWLQQIFLPNARKAVAEANLPAQSQVGVMAMRQYDYHSSVPEAQTLLELLSAFDELVEGYAALDS